MIAHYYKCCFSLQNENIQVLIWVLYEHKQTKFAGIFLSTNKRADDNNYNVLLKINYALRPDIRDFKVLDTGYFRFPKNQRSVQLYEALTFCLKVQSMAYKIKVLQRLRLRTSVSKQ